MKKTYFAPTVETVEIKTQHMLAASPMGYGEDVNDASGAEAPSFDIFE